MMKRLMILVVGAMALSMLGACSSVGIATPRNWQEKDWPSHAYEDVAEMTRSILSQKFKYSPVDWEQDRASKLITFSTLWNDRDASGAVFSGAGKRRKVWVEVEEVALDMRYDPDPNAPENRDPKNKLRIEVRDGMYKRIVTRVAVACSRERNDSTVYAGDPKRGNWKDDGTDDQEVAEIMAEIIMRLNASKHIEFDASDRGKDIHSRYFNEEGLSTAEKERINAERMRRIDEDVEKARKERE